MLCMVTFFIVKKGKKTKANYAKSVPQPLQSHLIAQSHGGRAVPLRAQGASRDWVRTIVCGGGGGWQVGQSEGGVR